MYRMRECIDICEPKARRSVDDFDIWMRDVKNGTQIIAVVAPAVAANFQILT